jgi:hypothetical protein
LHTDAATSAGVAVILCQKYDGTPYPLAFAPRALTIHEQKYSVREQECLSIIFGIKKFRPFLERTLFFHLHRSFKFTMASKCQRRCLFSYLEVNHVLTKLPI